LHHARRGDHRFHTGDGRSCSLNVPDVTAAVEAAATAPRVEIGTFVTTPTPRVGSATFPLTNHPPGVDVGHAGVEIEGVYAASETPVGDRVFHWLDLSSPNVSNCSSVVIKFGTRPRAMTSGKVAYKFVKSGRIAVGVPLRTVPPGEP
jgi:hypothetical protein